MDSTLRVMASQPPPDRTASREEGVAGPPLFSSDRSEGSDPLGRAPAAALLAELVLHKQAETPFCIGLLGAAGAGKSRFLAQVTEAAETLASAATEAGLATPFVADLAVVHVDAAAGGDAKTRLAAAVLDRLSETHPDFALALRHAGADPLEAARSTADAHNDIRRALDGERQALEALGGRDARLVDTVLETPGSLIDVYARAKRSALERIQRRFGFGAADPVATYKDLVREAAEQTGSLSRVGLSARALYAFKGQTRLIVGAVVLVLLAWGCAALRDDQQSWLASLRDLGERAGPVADWLQGHARWLGPLESSFLLLAVFLLLLNVVRAARFVLPISRGIDLLQQDLETRRRDLAGLLAHQTRRVDALTADADIAARLAADAERRVGPRAAMAVGPVTVRHPLPRPIGCNATAFFRALGEGMGGGSAVAVPGRILVAIDGLDQRTGAEAAAVLEAARQLFGRGVVAIAAAGQSHLIDGFGETDPARAMAQFSRCIQVPYRVGATDASEMARRGYALALIDGPTAAVDRASAAAPDARQSVLERPWRPREAETVAALASFAGETPRAVKTYVNLYRIARADPRLAEAARPVFTALALALALDAHGFPDDLSALDRVRDGEAPGGAMVLRQALDVAREASGDRVELGQAQVAFDVAASYSIRL